MIKTTVLGVSFDLWGTLIKSHPDYKANRVQIMLDFIYKKGATIEAIPAVDVIRSFEKTLDAYSEVSGCQITTDHSYMTLCKMLNVNNVSYKEIAALRQDLLKLLIKCPPQVIEGVYPVLTDLINAGVKIGLCSNTNLISGKELMQAFYKNRMGLFSMFSNRLVFSDEYGHAKPSPRIFHETWRTMGLNGREILHVGDNKHTDGAAETFGAKFLFVNHAEAKHKITDTFNFLNQCNQQSLQEDLQDTQLCLSPT
jgi:putative hydrolase of the HAD superfamily